MMVFNPILYIYKLLRALPQGSEMSDVPTGFNWADMPTDDETDEDTSECHESDGCGTDVDQDVPFEELVLTVKEQPRKKWLAWLQTEFHGKRFPNDPARQSEYTLRKFVAHIDNSTNAQDQPAESTVPLQNLVKRVKAQPRKKWLAWLKKNKKSNGKRIPSDPALHDEDTLCKFLAHIDKSANAQHKPPMQFVERVKQKTVTFSENLITAIWYLSDHPITDVEDLD